MGKVAIQTEVQKGKRKNQTSKSRRCERKRISELPREALSAISPKSFKSVMVISFDKKLTTRSQLRL